MGPERKVKVLGTWRHLSATGFAAPNFLKLIIQNARLANKGITCAVFEKVVSARRTRSNLRMNQGVSLGIGNYNF